MNTDKDGFSPAVFRSRLEQKISYRIFSLLRLCFVFYGEIYVKNEKSECNHVERQGVRVDLKRVK